MYAAFVRAFLATTVVAVLLIVGLGRLVDPFGHFSRDYTTYPDFTTDPNERFNHSAFLLNRALFKLVNFEKYAAEASAAGIPLRVIVGDSRAREVDPRVLGHHDGRPWYNLAYGSATLIEMLVLIDDLLTNHDVEEIIWVLPFTRLTEPYKNLMPDAIAAVRHPYQHLRTFEHARAVFYTLRHRWFGLPFIDPNTVDPRRIEADPRDLPTIINRVHTGWDDGWFATIDRMITRAEAAGVRVVLLAPPVTPELKRLFVSELSARYLAYRTFVQRYCLVDEAELRPEGWPTELFVDAYHLKRAAFTDFNRRLVEGLPNACGRNGTPSALMPLPDNLAASGG